MSSLKIVLQTFLRKPMSWPYLDPQVVSLGFSARGETTDLPSRHWALSVSVLRKPSGRSPSEDGAKWEWETCDLGAAGSDRVRVNDCQCAAFHAVV